VHVVYGANEISAAGYQWDSTPSAGPVAGALTRAQYENWRRGLPVLDLRDGAVAGMPGYRRIFDVPSGSPDVVSGFPRRPGRQPAHHAPVARAPCGPNRPAFGWATARSLQGASAPYPRARPAWPSSRLQVRSSAGPEPGRLPRHRGPGHPVRGLGGGTGPGRALRRGGWRLLVYNRASEWDEWTTEASGPWLPAVSHGGWCAPLAARACARRADARPDWSDPPPLRPSSRVVRWRAPGRLIGRPPKKFSSRGRRSRRTRGCSRVTT
jgi:hypothetical protein